MVAICATPMPWVVTEGVPTRMPEATLAGRGSLGIAFLFRTMPAASQRASASVPVTPVPCRSSRARWVSVPPVTARMPWATRPSVSACALAITSRAYCWYSGRCGLLERHRLGRHRVHQRPALHHREDRLVDAPRRARPGQEHPATRAAQDLVRGEASRRRRTEPGWGSRSPATRPMKWAASTMRIAPTSSEIARNAAKSMSRGIAEPPQMIILRRVLLRARSRTWS